MAGTLITDSLEQLQEQRKGFIQISLTDFDLTSVSQIALGSRIEISGSVIKFIANESMGTNWAAMSAGIVYAYINGTTYVSTYTETAPVWNTEKQGWYDATGAHRYYAKLVKDAGSLYTQKKIYGNNRGIMTTPDGGTAINNRLSGYVISAPTNITKNTIFDAMAPSISNKGDEIVISGSIGYTISTVHYIIILAKAIRSDATTITLHGTIINTTTFTDSGIQNVTITDGSSDLFLYASIAW